MKCGYIAGDDHLDKVRRGESPFCDRPVTRGSFCQEHADLCLIPARKPKRKSYQPGNHQGTHRWRDGRIVATGRLGINRPGVSRE